MAHQPPPSRERFGDASPSREHVAHAGAAGHAPADHEYDVTPPGATHEHTDANVWIIAKFGLWLMIAAVIVHIGMGLLFGLFVQQSEETEHVFPLRVGQGERLPVEPRLQRFPENEITGFRQQEENVLETYGWIDREAGRVQIPIAEAMRLTVERGLPVRPQPPAAAQPTPTPPATPSVLEMPADSSSGRTMERRRQ
jgi:hypothetical protein